CHPYWLQWFVHIKDQRFGSFDWFLSQSSHSHCPQQGGGIHGGFTSIQLHSSCSFSFAHIHRRRSIIGLLLLKSCSGSVPFGSVAFGPDGSLSLAASSSLPLPLGPAEVSTAGMKSCASAV